MLYVGQASLAGDIARYAQKFNLLEVLVEPGRLPKTAGLKKWLGAVGGDFAFSLRLAGRLWSADAEERQTVLAYFDEVARVLSPKVCLLQTPASATPTTRNKAMLRGLCERLRREGSEVAWEPRGVWEPAVLLAEASELGVLLVQDLSREYEPAPGSTVYTRLLALGGATRVRSASAETVAEKVADYERAFIVVEGSGAQGAGKIIREAMGELAD